MSNRLKSFNPANGDLVGEVAVATAEDVNEAVARARDDKNWDTHDSPVGILLIQK